MSQAERTGSAEDHGYSWVWVFVARKGKKRRSFGQAKSEGLRKEFASDTKKKKKWSLFSWGMI